MSWRGDACGQYSFCLFRPRIVSTSRERVHVCGLRADVEAGGAEPPDPLALNLLLGPPCPVSTQKRRISVQRLSAFFTASSSSLENVHMEINGPTATISPAGFPIESAPDRADPFSRQLLGALLSLRGGDFAVRMPSDLTGVNGK